MSPLDSELVELLTNIEGSLEKTTDSVRNLDNYKKTIEFIDKINDICTKIEEIKQLMPKTSSAA